MILCDTNILIEFYKAKPTVIQTLQRIGSAHIGVNIIEWLRSKATLSSLSLRERAGVRVIECRFTSTWLYITKAELFYGARDKQELAKIERHVALCHCYGLNEVVSALFIELMRRYSLSHKVSIPDMLIAATAISHDLELYTLNTKDFIFIPELNLYPID